MLYSHTKLLIAALLFSSSASAQSFDYPDFSDWTGISPVGLTEQVGPILRLQDNTIPGNGGDNRGAAWYADPVNVVGGFDTSFVYHMHSPSTTGGSDGMAFVIQNDQIAGAPMVAGYPDGTGNTAIGRHASAAGFGLFTGAAAGESVDNSLAIHLDTYNNGSWGDSDGNHISVHTGGSGDNTQHEDASIGRATLAVDLNDGSPHTMRVVYEPGLLEVHHDGVLILSVPYDFTTGGTHVNSGAAVGGLDLIGGTSAYVGFTGAAGGARETKDILSWEFGTGSGPGAVFCTGDGSSTICPCGNGSALGEGCGNGSGSGAVLSASGVASASASSLVFEARQLIGSQPGLYFQGNNAVAGGAGIQFGDGLRCAGGGVIRLQVRFAALDGTSATSIDIAQKGGVVAGDTKRYQCWYRDPNTSPCGTAFNLTNGYELTWGA